MQDDKQNYIGLGDLLTFPRLLPLMPDAFLRPFARTIFRVVKKFAPPALTNMGQIKTELLDFGHLNVRRAWLTASVLYPPAFLIGVSGFEEHLTLSSGFCQTAFSKQFVEKIMALMLHEISTAANS